MEGKEGYFELEDTRPALVRRMPAEHPCILSNLKILFKRKAFKKGQITVNPFQTPFFLKKYDACAMKNSGEFFSSTFAQVRLPHFVTIIHSSLFFFPSAPPVMA
ncbi:unnamed protein product [Larinioides sclopetarius]|uniref:Uncharacterized protein n=1 Tax=Larinioides sclopetarius TaxID=280406 RepID=A0AAV2BTJ0_9ARAC